MTREQKYIEQMRELGIWQEIFEPEVHTLAMLERDLQRLTKRWKDDGCPTVQEGGSGPRTSDKTLDAIMALRREILAHRDALGLTPKGLTRLKARMGNDDATSSENAPTPLSLIRAEAQRRRGA